MGFLKNIFKKKEGGSKLGNLLRGVSSSFTGGILGSGAGLAKSDAEFARRREEEAIRNFMATPPITPNGYKQLGQNLVDNTMVPFMTNGQGQTSPMIGQSVFYATMKKNWIAIVLAVALFGGAIYYFASRKNKPKKF